MDWLPSSGMWLSYLRVDARAGDLDYDLAIDASGAGQPSPVAAGLAPRRRPIPPARPRTDPRSGPRSRSSCSSASQRDANAADRTPGGVRSRCDAACSRSRSWRSPRARRRPHRRPRGRWRSGSTTRPSRSTRSMSSRARRCASSSRTRTRSITSSSSGTGPCRSRTSSGPRRSTRLGRGDHDPAGETVSTTFTFGERDLLFGCHLPGHYVYGMRGTVEVV